MLEPQSLHISKHCIYQLSYAHRDKDKYSLLQYKSKNQNKIKKLIKIKKFINKKKTIIYNLYALSQ